MKMSSYYLLRIPLPLPRPRNSITHCVRINHDGFDPGGSGLAQALKVLISWAESHPKHDGLPSEWATHSYLRRPITIDVDSTNDDILNQLEACGARVRVVTCEADDDYPWAGRVRELFETDETFAAWSTLPPQREPGEEDSILDA